MPIETIILVSIFLPVLCIVALIVHHIVDITIIWPDDKWEQDTETDYLQGCLQGIREHLDDHPIHNKEEHRKIINRLGRVYAEVHINPCRKEKDEW